MKNPNPPVSPTDILFHLSLILTLLLTLWACYETCGPISEPPLPFELQEKP